MTTRLYRSITDKKIFGVCGGLGQALNVDPTLLRFVLVVATIFSGGTTGLLYIVAGLVIPEEPAGFYHDHTYRGASGSWHGSFWGSHCNKHKKHHSSTYTNQGMDAHTGSYMGGASSHTMTGDRSAGRYTGSASGHTMHSNMSHTGTSSQGAESHAADELDALMREVEAKALRKEIEELKQRLAKFEKNDEQEKGDR